MNRIILIGNGFDLAHSLPTSYQNFIDWYWEQWKHQLVSFTHNSIKDNLCEFTLRNEFNTWLSFLYTKINPLNPPTGKELMEFLKEHSEVKFEVCEFLKNICQSVETKGWVDIENEYYRLLVSCSKSEIFELNHQKLNTQLNYLQNLLIQYLTTIQAESGEAIQVIRNIIYSPINPQDISVSEKDKLENHVKYWTECDESEFIYKMRKYNVDNFYLNDWSNFKGLKDKDKQDKDYIFRNFWSFFLPDNIMFLNFNYTSTINRYVQAHNPSFEINHIHGELSKPDSIIFGYGDELDENYKNISNLNDNEYLKNFKSIKYLESDRYRKALQFMDAAPFQVYILGHSCGNSDRTLLNTLFEHKNCVSVKPYYFKNGDKDNYLDIVQNISRNFTDMKLMRDRVVNKTFCEAFSEK